MPRRGESHARAVRPSFRRFLQDERGAATVELVFWIPVFVLMLMVIADASVFFLRYSKMWDVARDASRQVSVGTISGQANGSGVYNELDAFVQAELSDSYTATIVDNFEPDPKIRVFAPIDELTLFNFFGAIPSAPTVIVAEMRMRNES